MRTLAATLFLLTASACASKSRPVSCPAWSDVPVASKRGTVLASCKTVEPGSIDLEIALGPDECISGNYSIKRRRDAETLDSFADIKFDGKLITLTPQPRVHETLNKGYDPVPLGCDPAIGRFYVGHVFVGYLAAYRPDGKELWRVGLPKFKTIADRDLSALSNLAFSNLIESEGSVAVPNVTVWGGFVAESYRVKGAFYALLVHRSGAQSILVGPWDGILMGASPSGWRFVAGGGQGYDSWKVPNQELVIKTNEVGPQVLIDHVISRLLPRPTDTTWGWRHGLGDERFVRIDLGAEYDAKADGIAMAIHDGLGPEWFAQLASYPPVALASQRGDLTFKDWKEKLRRALLEAGADVDCMKYTKEHQLAE